MHSVFSMVQGTAGELGKLFVCLFVAEMFCIPIVMVVTRSFRSAEIPKIGCPEDDDATKH